VETVITALLQIYWEMYSSEEIVRIGQCLAKMWIKSCVCHITQCKSEHNKVLTKTWSRLYSCIKILRGTGSVVRPTQTVLGGLILITIHHPVANFL